MELSTIFIIAARPIGEFQGSYNFFGSLFIGISLILIAIGIILNSQKRYWIINSEVTTGKIVEVSKKYSRDDHLGKFPSYFPIVSFLVNGREFKKESDKRVNSDNILGNEVPVRYQYDNPTDSTLNIDNAPVMNSIVFFILGGLLFVVALFLMYNISK